MLDVLTYTDMDTFVFNTFNTVLASKTFFDGRTKTVNSDSEILKVQLSLDLKLAVCKSYVYRQRKIYNTQNNSGKVLGFLLVQ